MTFGAVLLVVGGFLLGGAWSMWRQSGEHDDPPANARPKAGAQAAQPQGRSGPQVVIAVILLIAALLATAAGILRLV